MSRFSVLMFTCFAFSIVGCTTPSIHQAVRNNNLGQVKKMVEEDPSLVNAQEGADSEKDGATLWTPLIYAADHKNYKIAKYLLENGADPAIKGSAGWTALDAAKDVGALRIEELIKEYLAKQEQ